MKEFIILGLILLFGLFFELYIEGEKMMPTCKKLTSLDK